MDENDSLKVILEEQSQNDKRESLLNNDSKNNKIFGVATQSNQRTSETNGQQLPPQFKMTEIESQMSKKTGHFGINSHLKKSEISQVIDTDHTNQNDKFATFHDNQDYQMMINQSTYRSGTNSIKFQTRDTKFSSMKYTKQ